MSSVIFKDNLGTELSIGRRELAHKLFAPSLGFEFFLRFLVEKCFIFIRVGKRNRKNNRIAPPPLVDSVKYLPFYILLISKHTLTYRPWDNDDVF